MSQDTTPIDILLYIALREEFNDLSDMLIEELGDDFIAQELEDIAITVFCGNVFSSVLKRSFRLAVVPAGKMGITRSATVTSAILAKSPTCDVVVLGIAGSLSNDLQPGDVFIPDSVNEYLANSATSGKGKKWTFQTSGNHFPTSLRLLNRFQVFQHTQKVLFDRWAKDCADRFKPLIDGEIQDAMDRKGLNIRAETRLLAGDDRKLASGPAVGKGTAFVEWIKQNVDRKVAAMEMESAGVYDAAYIRTPPPRVIAIRGISDFADERKELIEDVARDKFRAVSAKNSLSLFMYGIEAGLFREDGTRGIGASVSDAPTQYHKHNKNVPESVGQYNFRLDTSLVPKGSLRICLALGIPSANSNTTHCDKYLKNLARDVTNKDYRFLYPGTDAGNYASKFCRELLNCSSNNESRIISFIAEEFENTDIPQSLSKQMKKKWYCVFGKEIRYTGMTREIRRQRMIKSSDVCLLMAGSRAITHFFELCILLSVPVLPIAVSGGTTQELFRDHVKVEHCNAILRRVCGTDGISLFEKMNSSRLSPKSRAYYTTQLLELLSGK